MIRSLYSGISGMKNHQTRMDVTGNNIANVNTTGYKSGRVNFQDTLSQTVRSGGESRNPAQVGSGMAVASISNNFSQGPLQNTGRTMDLGIQGNGFFVVNDGTNDYYTREGVFFINNQGFLVNGDGYYVKNFQGDNIQITNGPVSEINIGPDGLISGINNKGKALLVNSAPVADPKPEPATPGSLIGDSIGYVEAMVTEAKIVGSPLIAEGSPLKEAIVKGNSSSPDAAPLGILDTDGKPPLDLSAVELTITYKNGDAADDVTNFALNSADLNSVTSWYDLVAKLQKKIDSEPKLKDKVKVSYDNNSGLVFKTNTPILEYDDAGTTKYYKPVIEIGGSGVNKYMGTVAVLTGTGTAVIPKDWVTLLQGKTFDIITQQGSYTGHKITDDFTQFDPAWTAKTGLSNVTSGDDLAKKLQNLLDVYAGDDPTTTASKEKESNVKVTWETDHLVFSVGAQPDGVTIPEVQIRGTAAEILTGSADEQAIGVNTTDWTNKDIYVEYNGTKYTFSLYEKMMSGLDNVTNGISLAKAVKNLINNKINSDKQKVEVTWDDTYNRLEFKTINIEDLDLGITPSIKIGGANAEDFVGKNPTPEDGTPSKLPPAKTQGDEAKILLVAFSNPEGLSKAGNNLFNYSLSAGEKTVGRANDSGFGTINSGYLEMSNVDLTEEFTNIITTQRGYQANARVITVSDTLLEELIQLKR